MKKQAFNPYLPSWEYIPDGEPYVFNGRVYVYGSHDFYNGYVFCMGDYVCWCAWTIYRTGVTKELSILAMKTRSTGTAKCAVCTGCHSRP